MPRPPARVPPVRSLFLQRVLPDACDCCLPAGQASGIGAS